MTDDLALGSTPLAVGNLLSGWRSSQAPWQDLAVFRAVKSAVATIEIPTATITQVK